MYGTQLESVWGYSKHTHEAVACASWQVVAIGLGLNLAFQGKLVASAIGMKRGGIASHCMKRAGVAIHEKEMTHTFVSNLM